MHWAGGQAALATDSYLILMQLTSQIGPPFMPQLRLSLAERP
jgi:hypothetical protein